MRIKVQWIICFFVSIIMMAIIAAPAYSGYVELNGKYVELHGPFCWDKLGVAQDEAACDAMMRILASGDKHAFFGVLNSYRIYRVEKNTKAVVLEVKLFEGKAKVLILTGLHKKFTGWVPLAWLDGNEKRPRIPEYHD
jgi:hypothetical protein